MLDFLVCPKTYCKITVCSAHITPLLHDLHWLPMVHFKVLLLTFKALNGLAPPYLSDLLYSYRSVSCPLDQVYYPSFLVVYCREKVI